MSEMVERGIRALALVNEQNGAAPYESFVALYGEAGARLIREQMAEQVRAVLAAMREPTEAMAAIGSNFVAYGDHGSVDVWRSMIDEALK